jgi:hypothetical protein
MTRVRHHDTRGLFSRIDAQDVFGETQESPGFLLWENGCISLLRQSVSAATLAKPLPLN